jgi:predicted AAA+ superfamily ATPase
LVKEEACRFENMVGVHLLKWVAFLQDAKGRDMELRYFRDVDGREVDFIIIEDQKPVELVECKWRKGNISKGLKYVKKRFPECNAFQITAEGKEDYIGPEGIRVCPALNYLNRLV